MDLVDNPADAPQRIEEGLVYVDFEIIPHWGNAKYAGTQHKIKQYLEADGYKVKTLTDEQAIVIRQE